ncbi:MAG: PD-(D/E)XK nuclease family protein [Gilliamella sp.]|nr:PD-(D/E)XK nuclease family protein [Gilliamella sp.]
MSIQKLLDDVTLWRESYKKANALFDRQLAPAFRLLNLFCINEMALSNCLAFLLDKNETHGQQDLFINKFYELFSSQKNIQLESKYQVVTEYKIPTGQRIDIFLTDHKNYIAIENKPWACDQKDQLKDYGTWLHGEAKNDKNWLLIYLCNREINEYTLAEDTDESIRDNVLHITFYELRNWLIDCALYVQAPKVKLLVEDLIQYIQENINGEINMKQQDELVKMILSNSNNLNSALLIANNIEVVKKELFNKFIKNLRHQTANLGMVGIKIEGDTEIEKRYAGFQIKFDPNDYFVLRWESQGTMQRDIIYGIRRKDATVQPNKKLYKHIAEQMEGILSSPQSNELWWPAWDSPEKNAMPKFIEDETWISFFHPQESTFTKSVIEIIRQVYEKQTLRALLKER